MDPITTLEEKFRAIWPLLDERTRRITAANEATALGHGGVSIVSRACGLSRKAISKGIHELRSGKSVVDGRVRKRGAGRKRISTSDPGLVDALESMVDEQTRGDPESPLRWICKSTRSISTDLKRQNHSISHTKVAQVLHDLKYSLQSNLKTEEGSDHPDRDGQFKHINSCVKRYLDRGFPVISVDTKKKELIGNYRNAGRQWLPGKSPKEVQGHDFPSPDVPRAYPYGIYDIGRNHGFVNIGTDHDTGEFAVASIRGWWENEGKKLYPKADSIKITADGGGSNGWRLRLWKVELQKMSDQTGLHINVSHFPPGTSKWNKIEHRLFSFISSNWRGEPLIDYETIVKLIANTTTTKGLEVTCRLDHTKYKTGIKVTEEELASVNIKRDDFHGEWNYVIAPKMITK